MNLEGRLMTNWLFSIDPEQYSIYDAFADTDTIAVGCEGEDIRVGDTVYIHVKGKDNRIAFRCEVTDRNTYTTAAADSYGGLAEGITFEGADLLCLEELPEHTFTKADLAAGGIRISNETSLLPLDEEALAFLTSAFEQAAIIEPEPETEETEEEQPEEETKEAPCEAGKDAAPVHLHTVPETALVYHGLCADGISANSGKAPLSAHRKMQGRPLSERKLRRIVRRG